MNETTMDLTPNFKGIFKGMLAEARRQADMEGFFEIYRADHRAEALRDVQRWFAPLAIAAQSMTSVMEVEQFRTLMADILADIDKTAAEMEIEAKEQDDEEIEAQTEPAS